MTGGFIVAIDGTAASGKSTTARLAARKLGFYYLDTGAMYRAITLKIIGHNVTPEDGPGLHRLLDTTSLVLEPGPVFSRVLLDGDDVTEAIRSPQVDRLVSPVSALPAVRERMVVLQRELADRRRVICEGRDMASVVFPDAQLKIFVDARIEERGRRRQKELNERGVDLTLAEVIESLRMRDAFDRQRTHSPLMMVDGAFRLDTTDLSIEEQVERVVALVRTRLGA